MPGGFQNQEKINSNFKNWFGVLGTDNIGTGAKYYFNENYPHYLSTLATGVWVQSDDIPVAANQADADAAVIANPTILETRTVRLTLDNTSDSHAYEARSSYGDRTSTLYGQWVMPHLVYNATSGTASWGYSVRLYHGNPSSGGVRIYSTSFMGTDNEVSWGWSYTDGVLLVSELAKEDFLSYYNTNGLWIVGYRYLGETLINYTGGTQGFQGMIGFQGPPMGYQGYQGYQGEDGYVGSDGTQGARGYQGDTGGPQGNQGFQGNRGYQGYQGIDGSQGNIGYQGDIGYQGNIGYQGLIGSQGFQGLNGAQGYQGLRGYQGYQGLRGYQGYQGIRGFQGYQGFAGTNGYQGYIGYQGDQGSGYQGSEGSQGDIGFQGPQGIGYQGEKGDKGDSGYQGYQGNNGLLGYQGFQGARGFQGYQGLNGSQGNQGFQGFQGFQGRQGIQGFQGIRGFQGYQGRQGDRGFQGFQGFQGHQGLQGIQGIQGNIGQQGFQGINGFQGMQGYNGTEGYQGYQGRQGAGFQGYFGYQGYQGNQGNFGYQGYQGFQVNPGYAAGNNTEVQFNNSGALDGDGNFTYTIGTQSLIVGGSIKIGSGTAIFRPCSIDASGDITTGWSGNDIMLNADDDNSPSGELIAEKVWNAVYNDYADFQKISNEEIIIFGRCYYDTKNGAKLCSERCQKSVIGIASDTFGFAAGAEVNTHQAPFAVCGWVLAYVDKEYESGTPLTNDEYGYLTEMSMEEKNQFPERLIAIYKCKENNIYWGSKNKKIYVDNRHWVKVK